jgi:TRAP-type C4-dicarboxylate transport system substrate-binding protein
VPLSLGNVLPALQQGTIDGALGGVHIASPFGYWDTVKYVNDTRDAYTFTIAVMSKRWFDALLDDLRPMVLSTAAEAGGRDQQVAARLSRSRAQDLGREWRRA